MTDKCGKTRIFLLISHCRKTSFPLIEKAGIEPAQKPNPRERLCVNTKPFTHPL